MEKEKLLVTINFSFSHSVFKRLVQQTHKNQDLFGKGLTHYMDFTRAAIVSGKRTTEPLLKFVVGGNTTFLYENIVIKKEELGIYELIILK